MRTTQIKCVLLAALIASPPLSVFGGTFHGHPEDSISGGARWDAAPRMHNGNERSLDGGLRYSVQGGSFEAYRDLVPWSAVPSVAEFQQAIEQAFAAWESTDPVTGLNTGVFFVTDLATSVVGSGNFMEGNPAGAEIDLLAIDGGANNRGRAFVGTTGSTVKLTSGTLNYPDSEAITGADIMFNTVAGTTYSLEVFRRLLTHEIGHALGLRDVDVGENWMQFMDDNFNGETSATARATLTNSWALLVDPMNPAASPLEIYEVPNADPGTQTEGVDILMESRGLGVAPNNPYSNLVPLKNDDYGTRQFLYPSLTFDFPSGDFNRDGAVDAADYVTWREGLGSMFVASDVEIWRSHFGQNMSATPSGHLAAIPEPIAWKLFLASLFAFAPPRRQRAQH